ncbi:MAG: FeoC-like transcriptional regulator [Thiogranum sp.]|jgi:bacterioferritin-associated ferredoxin|nr:FeoC-like transcriptional regulator [Thiogranum sp.]
MLSDIRRYLEQRGQASLADIALHCDTDPDAARGMLQVWIRKGKVHKQTATASCGSSCTKCAQAATEVYTWVDAAVLRRASCCPLPVTIAEAE